MGIKLLCLDMDGVLLDVTASWRYANKAFETEEEGQELAKQYLHLNYERLVEELVVKHWKGKDASPYLALVENMQYMEGITELFLFTQQHSIKTAIVSGGSMHAAKKIAAQYPVDRLFANELIIKDGIVTGAFKHPIGAGYQEKARVVRELREAYGLRKEDIVFVGDSKVDVDAMQEAGLSIAFNPEDEAVQEAADIVLESRDLRDVVQVLSEHI